MNRQLHPYFQSILEPYAMKHTEHEYIKAGYDFEKGRKLAQSLRVMIEAEDIDDRAEARRLVEQGRAEARK